MKKLLTSVSIASLLLPSLAFAAYNDVSLTTDAVLTVNGITLNVSGSTANIESLVVGDTLVVTLQANSAFEVTAPNLNKMTTNQQTGLDSDLCSGSISKMGYVASSTQIIATITPSSDLCTSATADNSGGAGSSSGGGGGGGGGGSTTATTSATVTTMPVAQMTKDQAILAIKTQLISLIKQLLVLLNKQLVDMKASGHS